MVSLVRSQEVDIILKIYGSNSAIVHYHASIVWARALILRNISGVWKKCANQIK